MDIASFHKHALIWRHQREEAERLQAEQEAMNIRAEWRLIAETIRLALPIEGMTLHETFSGQFEEMPRSSMIHTLYCLLDPSKKDRLRSDSERSIPGLIRVSVAWDEECETPPWKLLKFSVWVDGELKSFDNPCEAFLAVYPSLPVADHPD